MSFVFIIYAIGFFYVGINSLHRASSMLKLLKREDSLCD
jgi:hypothetical protein